MSTSEVKRRQIRSSILKWMYERLQSAREWSLPEEGDIVGFDWQDVRYELRRLEGDGFITGDGLKRITARGIEYLQDLGIETILASDLRERILAALYEADRQEEPRSRVNARSLAAGVAESDSMAYIVLYYLEDSGLVDVQSTMGDRFSRVNINARGMSKHEAIEAGGGGWASSTTRPTDSHEFVFGPSEEAEADRLLRDVTQIARSEILIVDPYARAGIISKLQHVPSGVKVRVLTSDRVAKEHYDAELQARPDLDIEIRALPKEDLRFHDRYIIVDGKVAWSWGHSFHDAGKTRHSVVEMRPVNRDRVMVDFRQQWLAGEIII